LIYLVSQLTLFLGSGNTLLVPSPLPFDLHQPKIQIPLKPFHREQDFLLLDISIDLSVLGLVEDSGKKFPWGEIPLFP